MKFESIEQAFELFEQTANVIEQECNCTYLEALAETADNIFHHSILQEELSEMSKKRLLKQYDQADFSQLDEETTRKAFQLAILKGMKDNIQPNHQMTPDTIGIFVSYLVRKFMGDNKQFRLFDPAIGTGNLVFTIMQQLKECDIHAIGIDVDDVLIKLAYSGANLLQQPLELYTGDSMKPLFIDPVDVVVSDLPVGYYPDDERASEFEVCASDSEEHTYAHHLLIEQSIKHLAEGGYGIYIVPNSLFESAQSVLLNQYLKKATYIQGLVALPLNLFKNEAAAKSVLIVQKKKDGIQQPKQALLAQLPHFSNAKAMSQMLQQMDEWFKAEKNN